jgi:cyclic beta-1,2-glucan synthetase
MQAAYEQLVRRDPQLILLFTPPFDRTSRNPGYVKGYPPGIRENGGQYTHAAVWVAWAFAVLGQGDRAVELFRFLNPISHSHDPGSTSRYVVEPYVVAADVYSVAPHEGRGGWTWYTGSAGWMWRLGTEAILGLQRRGNSLQVNPCIPREWPGFSAVWREKNATYHIQVNNPERANRGIRQVTLDGKSLEGNAIPLKDDGQRHEVVVTMGNP